jgi:hypothetical protein
MLVKRLWLGSGDSLLGAWALGLVRPTLIKNKKEVTSESRAASSLQSARRY